VQLRDAFKNSKSKKDKEEFKGSLQNVLESLNETISRSTDRYKQLNKNIEECQNKLNELQLYENKYMKAIKEYNKEYNKFNRLYN
jgi:chromosome segregation ATPase